MDVAEKLKNEELRIMTEQHCANALLEIDDMMDGVGIEFARVYLQNMDQGVIGSDAVVTDKEAKEFLEQIKAQVDFEKMMIEFIQHMSTQDSGDCREVFLNSKMLGWVRGMHQRYQRLRMYSGPRKMTDRKKTQPKLFNIPIVLDESVTEPRFW